MKSFLFTLIISLSMTSLFSQNKTIERVEPPNWWTGFLNDSLQIMIYGKNVGQYDVSIKSDAVEVVKINKAESPNYLFIDLLIKTNKPTSFDIKLKDNHKTVASYKYELLEKKAEPQGFSSKDMIYLLMPDRFSDGNPENDNIEGFSEKADRKNPDGRHGGDLQGIINHLDYFGNIGVTALWLNPVVENNNPTYSYHGYGITDFYKVDARLGNNELYRKLVEDAHNHNLKIIMDVVYNHCSINHWWIKDKPFADWIHGKNSYQHYHASVLFDPYASNSDKNEFLNSWFVPEMPDLNQQNPFLAKYLIQNTLWWIEYAQIDGLRIDTYAYCDQNFMNKLTSRIFEEYPTISIVGETWLQKTALIAPFQKNTKLPTALKTNLPSVTDFGLYYAIVNGLNSDNNEWQDGLGKIYYRMTEDYLYDAPQNLVIFIDNHDVDRIFKSLNEDVDKMKMAITLLMTMRGIPVLYYGTEIAMVNDGNTDGYKRKDFPGGWDGDKVNVFVQENLTETQQEIFDYVKKLALWRKNNKAVQQGKFLHFIPRNNIYVYFRYTNEEAVMVILNNSKEKQSVGCERYSEILQNYTQGTDIITGEKISLKEIEMPAFSSKIIELK